MSDDEELDRLLAAAPRIEEPILRLRERLQTGWQPKRDELDMRIQQRSIFGWQFAPSFSRPEAVIIGQPESRAGVTRTDQILWIDTDLRWALCEDGFWWLQADDYDTYVLDRAPDESDDEYLERCRMLGCDDHGHIRLPRRRPERN